MAATIDSIPRFRVPSPGPAAVQPAAGIRPSLIASVVIQIYLFLVFSRVTEYSGILTKLHIILLVALVGGVIAILTGGLLRAITTKIGICLTAATVWMLLAVPFSGWIGGSVTGLASGWLKSYIAFFLVAGIIASSGQLRKAVHSIAWATVVILIIVRILSFKSSADGRMMVDWGTFGNSNDLATEILLGLPFCLYIVTDKTRNFILRVFFALVSLFLVGTVLQTGSRGALLTMVLLAVFVFWKSSTTNKVMLVAAFALAATALPFVLSKDLKNRYLTLVMGDKLESMMADEEDLATVRSANESTEARRQLLIHAFALSIQHPIFGVGYDQFSNADADKSIAQGEEPMWHEVHNIFAVVMVENGIPAVLFFLAGVFVAFRILLKIYNRARKDPEQTEFARLALCLLASTTVFFVCNNFATAAYSMQFPVLGGLATALDATVRRQSLMTAAPPAALPLPTPVKPRRPALDAGS